MDDRASGPESELKRVFASWREEPDVRFMVGVRRHRAGQIRDLLADPERVDLATFNREVWQIESATVLHPEGTPVRLTIGDPADPATFARLAAALESGNLELHGNYAWRSGTRVYFPQLKDDAEKLENLQYALLVLNDASLEPIDKARQIQAVRGFGENAATGLVMLAHPDRFIIRNALSAAAFEKLGLAADSLEAFEEAAARLRDELGAEDFLELDLFLWVVAQGKLPTGSEPAPSPRCWWVNQGDSYAMELEGGYLWAPKAGKTGSVYWYWTNMAQLRVGDLVVHYANGAIRAVGTVDQPAEDAPRPVARPSEPPERVGYLARVAYHPLETPIQLYEIPQDWRYAGDGPFTTLADVKQGYLFPLEGSFVEKLWALFADRLPEEVRGLAPSGGDGAEAVAAVRAAVEAMYPDAEVRRACLAAFADGVERAHATSPASWAASMPKGKADVRLNVLWAQPCVLRAGELAVVFDEDVMDAAAKERVAAAFAGDPGFGPAYPTVTYASPYRAHIPADRLDELLPLVRDAYLSFVATCAGRVKSRVHRYQEHVPAVVAYLNEELDRDLPQPSYPTEPTVPTPVWLFQANPARWNLAEKLRERRDGDDESWSVSRFRDEMGPGQPVVLWQGGADAGIYALGELVDVPFERRDGDEVWTDRESGEGAEWAVPFVYTRILERPIPKAKLLEHRVLKDLSVIRGPMGTNFRVTPEQWVALQELVEQPEGGTTANWWVEKSKVAGWPYRQGGEYAVGRAIVAPAAASDGRDLYRNVRRVRPGDVVLHFTDTSAFTGWSRAAGLAYETAAEPGFDVAGDRALIVPLTDYRPIDPPLARDALFAPPYADRLVDLYQGGGPGRDTFYQVEDGRLRLKPQSYVTPASPDLVSVLKAAYRAQTGLEFGPDGSEATSEPVPPTIEDLAALTHMDRAELEELEALLRDKRQLVLEGPPGSGKTYLAERFARYVARLPLEGDPDERVETVQFHQSYGYEDFVQGIRPVTDEEGRLQYRVVPGIFARLCDLAARNPDQAFVLIVDEINRGNLSRIFGELLLLLEYRDKRVRLPYGSGDGKEEHAYLTIPSNLYLIGTMNSTDRSLALIDYALRRRFYFYRLLPVADAKAPVLERWLTARGLAPDDRERVLRLFARLNRAVEERLGPEYQVGHSYFMREDIGTEAGLSRVWRRAILPLLEEYLHGARDREEALAELTPEQLSAQSRPDSEPGPFSAEEV